MNNRLPNGARAGLLALPIAAAFAVAGAGAQASPVKYAGPAVVLVGPEQNFTFEFKSAEADEFVCSLDGADYAACKSPTQVYAGPGDHSFRVRAVDREGVAGPAAESDWFVGPIATPTPIRAAGSR